MSGSGFKNFREPVVYVLDQELRKRNLKNKISIDTGDQPYSGELVEYPVQLVRDSNTKKVVKCIYGTGTDQWSEELIRDTNGKVYRIKTTYPDGSTKTIQINKGLDNLVDNIDYV
ncbi:hypothetical protein [Clostridium ljungdahlii]|uniref:Uncharacterized protein n=1 Tax=Clostridium ljungdahlii (strain ATCC 55383 / DSM 13528 / PETC) TaxID=748727 RepID=D8GQ76_CLOLD|nr:hypothetical protein [Clostridium ljungdahlii]ADK16167.1 conserved hypothetical protein [Clostridium ljungdahlii DSM 13528]OAA89965.1 hypothetical protein WX45_01804 [Clostridium ljungdahlii DSM 13528]